MGTRQHGSKVLIGPWIHGDPGHVIGQMDFGFIAGGWINLQFDLTSLTQRWFDYWLKGIDNGITQEPPVKIFVMGDNRWRDEQEWPLARTQYTPMYLRQESALSFEQPDEGESPDHYVYDPADPTPTWGGTILMNALFVPGVRDQRGIESRADVLSYTSEPLGQDMEVTGPVTVKLWACSDTRDTDFVARLIDVHPDGFAQNLCDGIIRARYRGGDTPELIRPGQPYEYTIDLWATSNVFKAGHRVRLDIASASFPRWDRNPNTGDDFGVSAAMQPAHQTILHDAAHPSHVVLPIIPR
jgi:putative CocE/NonD family hydrolase